MLKKRLKRVLSLLLVSVIFLGTIPVSEIQAAPTPQDNEWDILDHNMFPQWNTDDWSRVSKAGTVTQNQQYVSINKNTTGTRDQYNWIVAKPVLPEEGFTFQVRARVTAPSAQEGNEISVRVNEQLAAFFLTYGTAGRVSTTLAADAAGFQLDTTVWHDYTMVVKKAANGYHTTLYVDDQLAWFEQPVSGYPGGDLVRCGADNGSQCNLDVASFRLGSGEIAPVNVGKITHVELSKYQQPENQSTEVEVTITTEDLANDSTLKIILVNAKGQTIEGVEATAVVRENQAAASLMIPDTLSFGTYSIRVSIGALAASSAPYEVLLERERPELPKFYADGYTIELEDYQYNPTQEFNFPSIIDTNQYPLPDDGTPLGRYYLFYAPHDAPAGLCLMTADSLDGPWTEYDQNPIIKKTWPKEDGSGNHYNVSHVSSPHVIWNTTYNEYFMYFHGENPVSRYATSKDMINWTYGGEVVRANDFSPTGSGHSEASYARVFEHQVPGLGNKYIMVLMINNSANMRKIFWAHSPDGKDWTAVKSPLLSPDSVPGLDYKGNLSGAYFFELDGRCYVIAHASTGNMYLFEVGTKLDEEIHWGLFYDSADAFPDYARAGAPCFMKADDGSWHMYYEGGRRLHANIVHAKTLREEELKQIRSVEAEFAKTSLAIGETLVPELKVHLMDGTELESTNEGVTFRYYVEPAETGSFDQTGFTAAAAGECKVWVEAIYEDRTVVSEKTTLRVTAAAVLPEFPTGTPVLSNSMASNRTQDNLELPWVIAVGDKYHLYYNYTNSTGGSAGIAVATADSVTGPWTAYDGGRPILTGAGGPAVIYHQSSEEYWMYYTASNNAKSVLRAVSSDGIHFTPMGEVLNTTAFGSATRDNTYQVSVYEQQIEGKENQYVMLLTGNPGGKKALLLAWSDDGITWENEPVNLLLASAEDGGNIASPRLLQYDGDTYLTFHNSSGNIEYARISDGFTSVERLGTLYDSTDGQPDNNRAADGYFYQKDEVLHMFYTSRSNKGSGAEASQIAHSSVGVEDDEILFQDDFEQGADEGWSEESGSWSVAEQEGNHVYQQSNLSGGANNYVGDLDWEDYSFEAVIIPTSNNAVVTMSGRVEDGNNRYSIGFNRGKLNIAKKVNGKDTPLYSADYSVEVQKPYHLRIEFEGANIRLYIDQKLEASVQDSSLTKGKVGIATYNTSAQFDNIVVRRLGKAPEQQAITLNDYGDHQVFQRELNKDGTPTAAFSATISVSGKYTSEEITELEARVVEFGSTAEVTEWTKMEQNPDHQTYSGELTVPQGGWYQLEVRGFNAEDQVVAEQTGMNKWGVGINILCVGQSNMQGHGKAPYTIADDLVANFRSGRWQHLKDPYDGAGASMIPMLGNKLVEKLGIPIGFVPAADSGSGLHQANIGHASGRYWLNRDEGNPENTSTIYGKSIARAKAAGGVELIIWNQGETDGRLSIPQDVYMADMQTLLDHFRNDLGLLKVPMFIAQIGNHAENLGETSTDLAYTAIRTAQRDLDDGENFFLAATEMEFDRVDTAHYNTPALNEIGRRYANAICYYYGLTDYYRGPEIASAAFVDDQQDQILVTIKHRGGTDFTPENDITGFFVYDDEEAVGIESASKAGVNRVLLTLEQPIIGEGALRYLFGFDPPRTNVIKDNTSLQLPLEATGEALPIQTASGVDKSILRSWCEQAEALYDLGNESYTTGSWQTFEAVLQAAGDVLADTEATQAEVNDAVQNLTEAMANLQKRAGEAVLSLLAVQVILAAELEQEGGDDYTAASWKAFEKALERVREILDDPAAYSQEEAVTAGDNLMKAMGRLDKNIDKEFLESLIEYAVSLEETDYTPKSWAVVQQVLADIEILLEDPELEQEQLKKVYTELMKALKNLTPRADLTALKRAVETAESLNLSLYTERTAKEVRKHLERAIRGLEDGDLTKAQADELQKLLESAIKALVRKSSNSNNGSVSRSTSTVKKKTSSWQNSENGWWWKNADGSYPSAEWMQIDGNWYYFNDAGYMAAGWQYLNELWYWLDPGSGKMVENDWVFYQDNWYYLGEDGVMLTGWMQYQDNWYYLLTDTASSYYGRMLHSTVTPDGYVLAQDGRIQE